MIIKTFLLEFLNHSIIFDDAKNEHKTIIELLMHAVIYVILGEKNKHS